MKVITINQNNKTEEILSVEFNKDGQEVFIGKKDKSINGIRSYTDIVSDDVFKILQGDNWKSECIKILPNITGNNQVEI